MDMLAITLFRAEGVLLLRRTTYCCNEHNAGQPFKLSRPRSPPSQLRRVSRGNLRTKTRQKWALPYPTFQSSSECAQYALLKKRFRTSTHWALVATIDSASRAASNSEPASVVFSNRTTCSGPWLSPIALITLSVPSLKVKIC